MAFLLIRCHKGKNVDCIDWKSCPIPNFNIIYSSTSDLNQQWVSTDLCFWWQRVFFFLTWWPGSKTAVHTADWLEHFHNSRGAQGQRERKSKTLNKDALEEVRQSTLVVMCVCVKKPWWKKKTIINLFQKALNATVMTSITVNCINNAIVYAIKT